MEILNNFGIQPTLLLAQVVNFLIILFLLKKFFYKPIIKVLEDRKKRIEESLANAQSIEEKLQKTQEQSAQILEEARENAKAVIDDAKKESERIYQQAHDDARSTARETVEKAKSEIERLKLDMQKQLESETLSLAATIAKKVLGRTLKPSERTNLTAKAITDVERQIQ